MSIVDADKLFHRCKQRIKDLGEVFTPEEYVEDMLSLVSQDKKFSWNDESLTFFEPTCGHGNIVIAIYNKRIEAFYTFAMAAGEASAAYYAIANSINTLWAIDIDKQNIKHCRSRILTITLDFLKEKLSLPDNFAVIKNDPDFMVHLLCAINWHIHENEMLSAVTKNTIPKDLSKSTRAAKDWVAHNTHYPLNFELGWVAYFTQNKTRGSIPLIYKSTIRFINSLLSGKARGIQEFDFACDLVNEIQPNKSDYEDFSIVLEG